MEYATTLLQQHVSKKCERDQMLQIGSDVVPWVSDIVFPSAEADLKDSATACKGKQSPAGSLGITQVCEALRRSVTPHENGDVVAYHFLINSGLHRKRFSRPCKECPFHKHPICRTIHSDDSQRAYSRLGRYERCYRTCTRYLLIEKWDSNDKSAERCQQRQGRNCL